MEKFKLHTERLLLRPLLDTDREELRSSIFQHPECVKTLLGDASTHEKQIEQVNVWYDSYAYTWDKCGYGLWGLYRKDDNSDLADGLLGMMWIEQPNDTSEGRADIGYALTPKAWGKGLITEAGRTVIDYVFSSTDIPAIDALIFGKINPGSVKVIEKLGGEYIGQKPALDYIDDEWMGMTHDYDLWNIRTVSGDDIRTRVFDASYRSGQFAAEGLGAQDEVIAEAIEAAKQNPEIDLTQEMRDLIREAVVEGMKMPGWSQYRIYRK